MEYYVSFYCLLIISSILYDINGEYIPPGPKYNCFKRENTAYPCKCINGTDNGLFIKCENTNLANLAVGFNNLALYGAPIEELTLYKCHIAKLYGTLFSKMKIRILRIEDTPIKVLDENIFYGVNKTLQELYIFKSNLSEFPKHAMKHLGNLTVLKIVNHNISHLEKDIFSGSLAIDKLEKLHLTNGELIEFPVESFQVLRKLKILDLHGNKLTALKRNQFKNLREVEVLDISFNNITKLESSHISDLTKLTWCNVSHNALGELTRGTFARNSVLKVLNMDHNNIKRLDVNSLRGMRFLRRVFFNDNNISEIGRGTFGSITRVGTIDLARNKIKKIDYEMFSKLNYVEVIDVSENNITEIQKHSFIDIYSALINISHNQISTIESGSFENCGNIHLDLSHNLISDIPKNAFDPLTYASEIQFSYNFLTDLSQVPLHNMTGLKILNVSHNSIAVIPKNTFPKLYELHTIDVSHNNITFIANAVFQTLFSIRNLNLSNNALETIPQSTFGTVPTLLYMDLSNNNLREIARGAFTKLSSLRYLTLENNRLERTFQISISLNHLNMKNNRLAEIPGKTWPSMNALISLDLSANQLGDSLNGESFQGLLTVNTLNLNSNEMTKIPFESLSVLSTLQYLNLENNNITHLSKAAFGKLTVLFNLNLHNNDISDISPRAFDGLLQLLSLNLSSNALHLIPNEAFAGLVSMRNLDLANNLIEKLDNKTNGLLDECLSLEKINLSNNKISVITRKMFPSNQYIPYRLYNIDLSYNLLSVLTFDITYGTKKTKFMNISHNSINIIRKGVLGNLTSIQTLDLSYNDLQDSTMESHTFDLPKNITNLYMSSSNIITLPTKSIENASMLNVLDVSYNNILSLDYAIIAKIKQGLSLHMEGNPLHCDCNIRPLTHFLNTFTESPPLYTNITCNSPKHVKGINLLKIPDDHLNCISNDSNSLNNVGVLPDIKFRDVSYSNNHLCIQWYVTAANKDIADFYINIRNEANNILTELHLPYNTRSASIAGIDILSNENSNIQVCVLAKNSEGVIRSWFDSQCVYLPSNFNDIKNKYTNHYNYAFSIMKQNGNKGTVNSCTYNSTSKRCTKNLKYIFILVFIFIFY